MGEKNVYNCIDRFSNETVDFPTIEGTILLEFTYVRKIDYLDYR